MALNLTIIGGDETALLISDTGSSIVAQQAEAARDAAEEAAASADADAIATALDRVATGQDRVQTGLDRTATAADRAQTGLDVIAADADAAAAAADRVHTGLDRVQTGLDRDSATASAGTAATASTNAQAARAAVEAAVVSASIGQPVIPLIGTADFHASLTFARASTATLQTPFAALTTLTEFASGAARFDPQFGLRIEDAATALDTNPRLEGAIAGTPGTTPSGMTITNAGSVTREIVGIGTEGGYHYIDIAQTLTATATNTTLVDYGSISVTAGLAYTGGVACRLISGTPPAMAAIMFDGTSGGASASFTPGAGYQFITPGSLVASGGSPVMRTRIRNSTAAFTGTFTLRYIFLNVVQSTVRSSLILPAVGAPGSTTRARDTLAGALSGLSLATPGITIVGRSMIPFQPASGLTAVILQISSSASDTNAVRIETTAGGLSLIGSARSAASGVTVNTGSLGNFTPGTEFAWGVSMNRLTGAAIFNVAGGTSLALGENAGPLSAIATHLRYGGRIAAGSGLNGFTRLSTGRPFIVSATDLAALVAAA